MARSTRLPRLPVKQLIVLSLCRVADPISFSSVFPYLPEMIESFDVPKDDVARWAGITSAAFSLSQAATGIFWGRASDRLGRKSVILTGMVCVMSSGILFGFSKNLAMAIVARCCAGASNGNVGTLRTVVAEMVPEKELQPRAFSVMPLVWTIGSIFGPAFGGALANPASRYPRLFHGDFFRTFPYALPNLVASLFFLFGFIAGFLFLKVSRHLSVCFPNCLSLTDKQETLESQKDKKDIGRLIGKRLFRKNRKNKRSRSSAADQEQAASLLKHSPVSSLSNVGMPASTAVVVPSYKEVGSLCAALGARTKEHVC